MSPITTSICLAGFLIAFLAMSPVYGLYASVVAGLVAEYKDHSYGNSFDLQDLLATVIGGILGSLFTLLCNFFINHTISFW